MKHTRNTKKDSNLHEAGSAEGFSQKCWKHIEVIVHSVRQPILILDMDLRVMVANEAFCRMFQVDQKDTEGAVVYTIGNGQWNIPLLRKLLEEILPQNTFFKGFEISHEFPFVGRKMLILNGHQIHVAKGDTMPLLPPIIFLAIEDVTAIMAIAETLSDHVKELASKNASRIHKLEVYVETLEKEIRAQKKKPKS